MSLPNSANQAKFNFVLPQTGALSREIKPVPALCKPKILPIKSLTLDKLQKLREAADTQVKREY